nr:uncharacterized protein LOC109155364 [Ipomoea batatas]
MEVGRQLLRVLLPRRSAAASIVTLGVAVRNRAWIDKGKGKADEQPPKKRFSWRIRAKKVEKQRNDLRAALSQPIPRDTSANPVEDSQSPPQPVISLPGFYSTSLAPSDQSQAPPSPNPSISQGNWSDIQRWYNENHAGVRGLSPPPVNPDLDDDYVQYLNELPNNENDYEEEHLSSIQENELVLGQPGYAPRAPAYDSNTREWELCPVVANKALVAQPSAGVSINNKIKVRETAKPLISITRDDVAIVLGLPCGAITITERDTQFGNPLLSEWREELRQPKGKVMIMAFCNELLTHNNGGMWFRRHFSVVVVSTLIESEHNGYVNQKIVHIFGDTDKITELDWCVYLLKCLVSSHEDWTMFRRLKYTGPILFLMLLYANRVVVGRQDNTRVRPVLKGWTSKLLKQREAREISAGGFGLGHLDTSLHLSNIHVHKLLSMVAAGLLESFLHTNGHPRRVVLLRNLKLKRMLMAWRVPTNNHDSGVYAMRHMESFLG